MNIEKLISHAAPMDIILTGGDDFLSTLICNGQRPQTPDGKPSKWSHSMFFWSPLSVIESTIDFKPYRKSWARMDNGVQFNYLENHRDVPRALLMRFPWTVKQRQLMKDEARRLEEKGIAYPVSGLIGSLLSYWLFPWKSNPLQGRQSLYCSAFIQRVVDKVGIDFDPKHTANNTSVEIISQYDVTGLEKIDISDKGGRG